jgi:DNA-binding transcriptional LysR family regulator
MRAMVTVNSTDAYRAACEAGLGIIQAPRNGLLPAFADGTLVEILPEFPCAPLPVTLLHTHGRTPPRRVRAVLSWISDALEPYFMA